MPQFCLSFEALTSLLASTLNFSKLAAQIPIVQWMYTDSLNAYEFIQLDEIVFSDAKATLQPPMHSGNLAG